MAGIKKYLHICAEIRKRIRTGVYTERLPARRELMAEFQISSRTMHKVFDELKLQGIVTTTHGGTIINRSVCLHAAGQVQILLISPPEEDSCSQNNTCTRIRELAEKDLVKIVPYARVDDTCSIEDILKLTVSGNCAGVIFLNSSYTPSDGKFLKEHKIPFVSANRPPPGENINWIDWNHLELFDDMLGEAVSRGARSIDFFMPELPNGKPAGNSIQILEDFRAAKKSYMLYNSELDDRDLAATDNIEKYARFLAGLKHLPDIIWLAYFQHDKLCAELHKYGIDLSSRMICVGGKCEQDEHTQIVYTEYARRQLGEKIWQLMQYVRHHPDAPPRGVKQRCKLKVSQDFKKIKFNH